MSNPNGAIQAISSAAATTLGLGIAFLGFWAYGSQSNIPWSLDHLWVLIPISLGYVLLASVPFLATRPTDEENALRKARGCYGAGMSFLLIAIAASFFVRLEPVSTSQNKCGALVGQMEQPSRTQPEQQ
jgi:hypothetical protein